MVFVKTHVPPSTPSPAGTLELAWEKKSAGFTRLRNPIPIDFGDKAKARAALAKLRKYLRTRRIDKVWCTACANLQGGGAVSVHRLKKTKKRTSGRYICARWPGAVHECDILRGRPRAMPMELTNQMFDALADTASSPEMEFRLRLSCRASPKTKQYEAIAAASERRKRSTPAKPSRRLSGATITLFEKAGLTVWRAPRGYENFWGICETLHSAYINSGAIRHSLGCEIIFPEVEFGGITEPQDNERERFIRQAAKKYRSTRFPHGRVVIIGRLCGDPYDYSKGLLKIVSMGDCGIGVSGKTWDMAVESFGLPEHYEEGKAHKRETICACVVEAVPGRLVARHVAWLTVDHEGVPFFESDFEPLFAEECYRRGIPFIKPCHVRFRVDDRIVWPDFLLQSFAGQSLVLEVDPGGAKRSGAKMEKHALLDQNEIIVISFDPKNETASELPIWDHYFPGQSAKPGAGG
jgi:hypothetical protein